MTADELREVGEYLYGPRWQSPLARDIDIDERAMRRMASGERPVPIGVAAELIEKAAARVADAALLTFRGLEMRDGQITRVTMSSARDMLGVRATEIFEAKLAERGVKLMVYLAGRQESLPEVVVNGR